MHTADKTISSAPLPPGTWSTTLKMALISFNHQIWFKLFLDVSNFKQHNLKWGCWYRKKKHFNMYYCHIGYQYRYYIVVNLLYISNIIIYTLESWLLFLRELLLRHFLEAQCALWKPGSSCSPPSVPSLFFQLYFPINLTAQLNFKKWLACGYIYI